MNEHDAAANLEAQIDRWRSYVRRRQAIRYLRVSRRVDRESPEYEQTSPQDQTLRTRSISHDTDYN